MKNIKTYLLAVLSLAIFVACERDGDLITLSGFGKSELLVSAQSVELTQETSAQNALSVTWTKSTLTVSDTAMAAPDVQTITLQISNTQDFSGVVVETVESNLSHTFTGAELNTVAQNLGLTAGVPTPVYFRIKGSIGANMDPLYSEVVTVTVKSYKIDMSRGFILNKDQDDTGFYLYSPASNGVYTGFMGATAWYNFWMKEGDGTIWGNNGVTGTPFEISSASGSWNCWFPGLGGCYLVEFNTGAKTWASTYIPALTVSGDITGTMTFDRPNVKWTLPFTATSTSLTIQISGTGAKYDYATGTNDAAAVSTPVAFVQNGSTVALASTASNLTVTVAKAGSYTLTIDLKDPQAWSITAVEGTDVPVVINPYVYLPGIDDGTSGGWNFNNKLALYNEDNLAYAGVVAVNSLWGYTINTEVDNWSDKYTPATGDASAGTLVFQGSGNIPAPAAGLYLFDVSLKNLSYALTSVGSQIYISGLNDVWDFATALNATSTPGEYQADITVTKVSAWGFQVHLDSSWGHYFGGSGGKLYYKGSNITDDATLGTGTYDFRVNLITGTYSMNKYQ